MVKVFMSPSSSQESAATCTKTAKSWMLQQNFQFPLVRGWFCMIMPVLAAFLWGPVRSIAPWKTDSRNETHPKYATAEHASVLISFSTGLQYCGTQEGCSASTSCWQPRRCHGRERICHASTVQRFRTGEIIYLTGAPRGNGCAGLALKGQVVISNLPLLLSFFLPFFLRPLIQLVPLRLSLPLFRGWLSENLYFPPSEKPRIALVSRCYNYPAFLSDHGLLPLLFHRRHHLRL